MERKKEKKKYEVRDGFVNCVLGLDIHSSHSLLYSLFFLFSFPLLPSVVWGLWAFFPLRGFSMLHSLRTVFAVIISHGPTFF